MSTIIISHELKLLKHHMQEIRINRAFIHWRHKHASNTELYHRICVCMSVHVCACMYRYVHIGECACLCVCVLCMCMHMFKGSIPANQSKVTRVRQDRTAKYVLFCQEFCGLTKLNKVNSKSGHSSVTC